MPTTYRRTRLALAAIPLILLAACGTSDDTSPTGPEPTVATDLALHPSGGAFLVPGDDGSELLINVPAGAVAEAVTVSVTPEAPRDGALARYRIEPSGVPLLVPATVSLRLADGQTVPTDVVFSLYREQRASLLPTTVDLDTGTIVTTVHTLGPSPEAAKTFDGAGWLQVDYQNCLIDLEFASQKLTEARNSEWYPATVRECIDSVRSLQQQCQQEGYDALIQRITDEACEANVEARLLAYNSPMDLSGELMRDRVRPLLSSQALKALVDADDACGSQADTEEAITHLFTNHLNHVIIEIAQDEFLENTTWPEAWYNLNRIQTLWVEAALLGQTAAEDRIRDVVLPAMLDQFRRVAYRDSRENHVQGLLADILSGGHMENHPFTPGLEQVPLVAHYENDDIITDMHMAVTDLTIAAWNGSLPAEPIAGGSRWFGGGEEPGTEVTTADAITVPSNGSLVLDGQVWAFLCHFDENGGSAAWDDNHLLVAVDGHILDDIDHDGDGRFLDLQKRYQVSAILDQLDLDPGQHHALEITVSRTGVACDWYGPEEHELCSVTVNVEPHLSLTGVWEVNVDIVCLGMVSIEQDGTQLAAAGGLGGQDSCPFDAVLGQGSGTLDGQVITLGMAFSELGSVEFTGEVNASFESMSGTYSGGGYAGSWTAFRGD